MPPVGAENFVAQQSCCGKPHMASGACYGTQLFHPEYHPNATAQQLIHALVCRGVVPSAVKVAYSGVYPVVTGK